MKMFMTKNRHAPKMSEASSNATPSLSKQLLKNIHPMMSASFCSLTKTFTVATPKKNRMTIRTSIHQRRYNTPVHTIVQSLMASLGESQGLRQFDICRPLSQEW